VKASENTNLCIEFLLQIQKQWKDSAMLLASNKQQHKEITKSRMTQEDGQNAQKKAAGKNKDQVGFQEAPHLQDSLQNHSEYSKC
jgi:hypothetical protein